MATSDFEHRLIVPRLESLESTLSEISYREAVKNASNFNARLTVDRKHRNPFLDSQTGLAQSPSTLYFNERQRLPGLKVGQIYSYPAKRWRKKRRQYLSNYNTAPVKRKDDSDSNDVSNAASVVENPSVSNINEDSKDSIGIKDQDSAASKDAWYYDEMEMHDMDCFDEPDADSDFDYEDSYSARSRKKKRSLASGGGGGSSRSRSSMGSESPTNRRAGSRASVPSGASVSGTSSLQSSSNKEPPLPVLKMEQNEKPRAKPSPYCDFCLGDTTNKKSGQPEDLVSCSDCGRSGHPTCLQFTNNMKVSVKQYRWQCIECKCCSVCGTSDNDDQLLFCDDCDRGYHMYCLVPPIQTPPEGSWSCQLCLKEFHRK
ncbi:hypothetical protein M8J77_021991 [Diaphorina citri]|nr:hypothetical protein M8J77_021991 [Diaphorina citri]